MRAHHRMACLFLAGVTILSQACKKDESTNDSSTSTTTPTCPNGQEYNGEDPNPCGEPIGGSCVEDADCSYEHCADGVCCISACDAPCSSCEGGSCELAAEGTDPRAECAPLQIAGCSAGGACNGSGVCASYSVIEATEHLTTTDDVNLSEDVVVSMASAPGRVVLVADRPDPTCMYGRRELFIFDEQGGAWVETGRFDIPFPSNICIGQGPTPVALAGGMIATRSVPASPEGFSTGVVRVFTLEGGSWQLSYLDAPDDNQSGGFGSALATDGQTVIVGDPHQGSGVVRTYQKPGASWQMVQQIPSPSGVPEARFGANLSLAGTRLLIGDPGTRKAYVYSLAAGMWSLTAELASSSSDALSFGSSVLLRDQMAFVRGGAGGDLRAWVEVFSLNGGSWTASATLKPFGVINGSQNGIYSRFGDHLAYHDGTLIVGADAQAYFFYHDGSNWVPRAKTLAPPSKSSWTTPVAFVGETAFVQNQWFGTLCATP